MLRAGDLEGIPPEESGARGWRIPAAVVEKRRRNAPRKEQAPPGDPHAAELVEVLREQVEDLRARLDREQEANRENRRLLAAALERIPELEAPGNLAKPRSPKNRRRAPALPGYQEGVGQRVSWAASVSGDFLRQIGAEAPVEANAEALLQGGKLKHFTAINPGLRTASRSS